MTCANSYDLTLSVTGRDFVTAGEAASQIKRTLEALNYRQISTAGQYLRL